MCRMWEIRESYGEHKSSFGEMMEAYKCGYKDGYEKCEEEHKASAGRAIPDKMPVGHMPM